MLGSFFSSVFWFFFSWFSYFAGWICLIGLILYVVPIILTKILPVPNLKKKYQSEWALVTGGTSGIGAELTIQLAEQGLNVVIVGLPDKFMESHKELLAKRFPNLKFLFIAVNLGKDGYLEEIKEQTKNLDIGIVFLNAGFFNLGAIYKSPLEKHMAQTECNALSGAKIAYHFYDMWREQNANPQTNKPRAICFTSSSVHYLPGAYSCFYGATKGFVTSLALSLAVEAKHNNIHVCCVMPQYTRTNLYQNTQKLSMLDALDLIGSNPDHVAKTMIKAVGYGLHHRDQGIYSIGTGLVGKLVDQNLLVNLFSYGLKLAPEYKAMK